MKQPRRVTLPVRSEDISRRLMTVRPKPSLPVPVSKKPPSGWLVGHRQDGSPFTIPDSELFQTHMHIIGTSGWGKSFALYNMICQTIRAGHGMVLVDPDSQLYLMTLNYLVQQRVDPKRVIIVNPLLEDWTVKMNPLQSWDGVVGLGTDLATGVMLRAAGEDNFEGMPRLRLYLKLCCTTMEQSKVPLALMPWLCGLSPESTAFRNILIERIGDPLFMKQWDEFAEKDRRSQTEHLDSTINRAIAFADDVRIRQMMVFSEGNVDWKEVMDEGKIVLCNLGQQGRRALSKEARQLIGASVIHGVVQAAERRRLTTARRCFLFCDEFSDYVSSDVARGLDRCRKFNVHFVLAHQRIGQIEIEHPDVMEAVLDEAKIRLVFGGLGYKSAERMAQELFTAEIDGNEIKRVTAQTAFRPLVQWVDIVTKSVGGSSSTSRTESTTHTSTRGGGHSASSGSSHGVSVLYTPDRGIVFPLADGYTTTKSFQEASSTSSNWSEGTSYATAVTYTEGENWSEAVSRIPMTVHEEFYQPEQIERVSLEEQKHHKIGLLMSMPRRRFVIKFTGEKSDIVNSYNIEAPLATWEEVKAYEDEVCQVCPYMTRPTVASEELTRLLLQYNLERIRAASPVASRLVIDSTCTPAAPSGDSPLAMDTVELPKAKPARSPPVKRRTKTEPAKQVNDTTAPPSEPIVNSTEPAAGPELPPKKPPRESPVKRRKVERANE